MRILSMSPTWLSVFTAAAGAMTVIAPLHAHTPTNATDPTELSLQELTNEKVATRAKRPQRAAGLAADSCVITQDAILPATKRAQPGVSPQLLQLAAVLE
jgi:hypothetical protein